MSDINSGLPIRSQIPSQVNYDDIIVKIGDSTTSNQLASVDAFGSLKSRIADASGSVVTSQANGLQRALDIGINVAGVQIDPRVIRALTASDVITASNFPATVDTNFGAVGSSTIRTAAQIGNATGAALFGAGTTTSQVLRVVLPTDQTAIPVTQSTSPWVTKDQSDGPVTPGTVASFSQLAGGQFNTALPTLTAAQQSALQLTSNGELITVQDVGGAPVSSTNPLPVTFSSAPIGTPINDYKTVASLAAAASDNHDYTITAAKVFQGKMIWASASGLIKIEVQISADGTTFFTKWVGWNSTSTPNISIQLDQMVFLESGTGSKIRVIVTNEDKKAQDVYSTISGLEV